MDKKKNVLLVEGESDRSFFEIVCRQIGLENSVTVAPPKQLLGKFNSKEGVFNHLPILLRQFEDGSCERLAVILDADYPPNGNFGATRDRVNEIVAEYGYITPPLALPGTNTGLVYRSKEGFNDFGLWVMPDNSSNGMLEDWLKSCVSTAELPLMNAAIAAVSGLAQPVKFNPIHASKAEVATWLAWQKRPGHGMYQAAEERLLDCSHLKYVAFVNWLKHIFS